MANITADELCERFEYACRKAKASGGAKTLRDVVNENRDKAVEMAGGGRRLASASGAGHSQTYFDSPGPISAESLLVQIWRTISECLKTAEETIDAADTDSLSAAVLADDRMNAVTEYRADFSIPQLWRY